MCSICNHKQLFQNSHNHELGISFYITYKIKSNHPMILKTVFYLGGLLSAINVTRYLVLQDCAGVTHFLKLTYISG